jgi:branched-chain amino acid transport system substrate-binding protein
MEYHQNQLSHLAVSVFIGHFPITLKLRGGIFMEINIKKVLVLLLVVFALLIFSQPVSATEYNISGSVDYTGPYAVVMTPVDQAGKIMFAWWNEEIGKRLGVKLNRVVKDTRYDPALTASLWPGILSSLKPILHQGLGGPDVAALMKRLPQDKVPMVMSTATYGFIWLPNQWVFQPRPTYVHEAAGFFNWAHMNLVKDRPLRVAAISSKVSPAYVDSVNGFEAFAKVTSWVEFVGVEWVKMKPISLVSEIRRLAKKNPDFIWIMTNTYQGLGCIKAQKELGIHIPVVLSSHNGIQMSTLAAKDINILEGHYDVCAMDPALDTSSAGAQVFEKYKEKLGFKTPWSLITLQGAGQALIGLKAVERAIVKVGADNVTGKDVYNAFYAGTFDGEEDLLGLMPSLTFTKSAPFSEQDIKVKATKVTKGKQVLVGGGWTPVPKVPKWVKP